MIINTDSLTPDLAGETLRYLCFTKDGFGCYSNFDLEGGFAKMNPLSLIEEVQDICTGDDKEEARRITAFHSTEKNLTVFWYWDGDGTLGFVDGNRIIFNTDCKKDHDWQEIVLD